MDYQVLSGRFFLLKRKLIAVQLLSYFIHADAGMAFIINAFTIFDEQYLRRLMIYRKILGNFTRNVAVLNQIEIIKISILWRGASFKAVLCYATDTATGTVFENNLWFNFRPLFYFFQLSFIGKCYPVHAVKVQLNG